MDPRERGLNRPRAARLSLTLSALLVLLAMQGTVLGLWRVAANAAALNFNMFVLAMCLVTAELIAWMRVPQRLVTCLLGAALTGALGMVFAHAWFFDVAIERRLTLLDFTISGLWTFFAVALPWQGWVAMLATALGFVGGAWGLRRRFGGRVAPMNYAFVPIFVALLPTSLLLGRPVRSPLYDQLQEAWLLVSLPPIGSTPQPAAQSLATWLDKSARTHAAPPARYRKVIVLVMETMTARTLEAQARELPQDSFLRREADRIHSFDRYYPNNQDSRTGMLNMLFSRVVPYEAYSGEGVVGYRGLARVPSLVERMRALGYQSAFAVSQTSLEEVVEDLSWDETLRLSQAHFTEARGSNKLCFAPDVYEQSCEDLVLLPQVVDFVVRHERAFVYQEFIWGHAAEYNEASGLSNAAYYSGYVDALRGALVARGLGDDTLIVLTSDHGFRDKGRQHDPEVYRVPLLFHAAGLAPRSDARLRSHADFGMLLQEELSPAAPRADDNPFVMIVGPTGQGHTFVVGQAGGHLLLWNRLGGDRVLARGGPEVMAPELAVWVRREHRARFNEAMRAAAH